MSYSLIYQTEWDSLPKNDGDAVQRYTDKIYKKNYTGVANNVLAGNPAGVHQWLNDDPKAPVKGSNYNLTLVNPGNLPLSNFFSVEDDTFKIEHYWGTELLFTGFLVQSDCTEVQVDIIHYIDLSFTDNLGLLKDVPFDQANRLVGDTRNFSLIALNYNDTLTPGNYIFRVDDIYIGANIGDTLVIHDTAAQGVYRILNVIVSTTVTFLYVAEPWTGFDSGLTVTNFSLITPQDLTERIPLTKFLEICIKSTSLELNTNVYGNLQVDGGATGRWLEDAYLNGETFLTGKNWQSCYEVLTIICTRFKCSLFQSNGVWNIIRWDELRYYNNEIPGFPYDVDFVYTPGSEPLVFRRQFTYGDGTDIETGLLGSILRPFKFDKETFNYKQPENLLRNANLQELGALVRSYTSGPNTIKEYEAPFFTQGFAWSVGGGSVFFNTTSTAVIRITIDPTGNEILRTLAVGGPVATQFTTAIQATPIELNAGDVIEISFSVRTSDSHPGIFNEGFLFFQTPQLVGSGLTPRSANYRYLSLNQQWSAFGSGNPGASIQVTTGEDGNQWHNISITSKPSPFNTILYINFSQLTGSSETTEYKDISLNIVFNVNESLKITGHTHTDTQNPVIKNNGDEEIFIDDSPRNSINGTTFLSSFTGVLQDRTQRWNRGGITESKRIGEITTFEQLFHRSVPRSKYEGNLLGLVQQGILKSFTANATVGQIDSGTGLYYMNFPGLPVGFLAPGDTVVLSGSALDEGTYTVATILSADSFTVLESMVDEETDELTLSVYGPIHLSMLNLIRYTPNPLINLVFGTLTVDYKNNQARGTLWEMYADGEEDADLNQLYNFKYLYQTT